MAAILKRLEVAHLTNSTENFSLKVCAKFVEIDPSIWLDHGQTLTNEPFFSLSLGERISLASLNHSETKPGLSLQWAEKGRVRAPQM